MKHIAFTILGAIIGAVVVLAYFASSGRLSHSTYSNGVTQTEKEMLEKAMSCVYAADHKQALEILSRFEKDHPRSARMDEVIYWSAYCSRELKDHTSAIQKYERLSKDYPRSKWAPEAGLNLAAIYDRDLKDIDRAVTLYGQVVSNYPGTIWANRGCYNKAVLNDRRGQIEDAEKDYNQIWVQGEQQLKIQQESAGSNYFVQQAKKRLDFINAHSDFDRKPLAIFNEAQALKEDGRHLEAVGKLKKLLQDYPGCSLAEEALVGLVQIYRSKGLATEAQEAVDILKKEYPKSNFLEQNRDFTGK